MHFIFLNKTRKYFPEPPRITLHPPKQTVKPNDEAYIRCSAVGSTPISIRWQSARGSFPSHIVEVNGELRVSHIVEVHGKLWVSHIVEVNGKLWVSHTVEVNQIPDFLNQC